MRKVAGFDIPDVMPVLSAGKHRSPKRGACLMEYTSFLAGEKFSDAPRCTDPTLATIARAVNDYSSDSGRQRLAVLASELTAAAPLDVPDQQDLARRCLLTALPLSAGTRRRTLVVALLGLERAVAGAKRGFGHDMLGMDAEFALLGCDADVAAARSQVELLAVNPNQHHKQGLSLAIELAIATIADEATGADAVLHGLLVDCLRQHRDVTTAMRQEARARRREVLRRRG